MDLASEPGSGRGGSRAVDSACGQVTVLSRVMRGLCGVISEVPLALRLARAWSTCLAWSRSAPECGLSPVHTYLRGHRGWQVALSVGMSYVAW